MKGSVMYVDAMVAAVKTAAKDDYVSVSERMGAIFMAHGATSYRECWGEDVPVGKLTSFPQAVKLAEGETVAVCVIAYPDKATRDACMGAVMSDPAAEEMMQSLPMDGKRMIFGGFDEVVTF